MNKLFYALVFFLGCQTISLAQSGWTKNKGSYYLKISAENTKGDEHFNINGDKKENINQGFFALNTYLEYGVTDKWTFTGLLPIITKVTADEEILDNNTLNAKPGTSPLGDALVGMKYRLYKNNWLSTALTGQLRLPLGNGELNESLTLSAGASLYYTPEFSVYANLYVGANNRHNDFSDEARYGAEVGVGFNNKLWLILKQNNITSFNNGDEGLTSERALQLFGNNFEFNNLTFETAYYIKPDFGLTANFTTILAGQQILTVPTVNFGIFWNKR